MSEKKNFVIDYEDWDSYSCVTRDEAVRRFRQERGASARILRVSG